MIRHSASVSRQFHSFSHFPVGSKVKRIHNPYKSKAENKIKKKPSRNLLTIKRVECERDGRRENLNVFLGWLLSKKKQKNQLWLNRKMLSYVRGIVNCSKQKRTRIQMHWLKGKTIGRKKRTHRIKLHTVKAEMKFIKIVW